MPHHSFVSTKTQGGDATIVDANEWNAALVPITTTLSAPTASTTALPLTITVGASNQILNVERVDVTVGNTVNDATISVASGATGQIIDVWFISVHVNTANIIFTGAFVNSGTTFNFPWKSSSAQNTGVRLAWTGSYWAILGFLNSLNQINIQTLEPLTNDPTNPTANLLQIYAKNIGGRLMPKWMGPSGIDVPFQAGFGFQGIKMVAPAQGSTAATCMSVWGSLITNTATTVAQVPVTSTSIKTRMKSVTLATSTTAGTIASHITQSYEVCGSGGFFFSTRFYLSGTIQAGQRAFFGLRNANTTPTNIAVIAENLVPKVGIAFDQGVSPYWQLVASTAAASMTAIVLSTLPAANVTDVLELILFQKPNDANIYYRVINYSSTIVVSGVLTTNIPAITIPLAVQMWTTNNASAAVATMGINKWYLESDY